MTTIDTTTGLPYTGDAPRVAADGADPLAGMIPGRSIGRAGSSSFVIGKAPGEATNAPSVTQSIYTPPVTSQVYMPPVSQGVYTPPVTPPVSEVYTPSVSQGIYTPPPEPEPTWVPGVPNVVTGLTALALGYALYKTFFEAPRANPSMRDERENPNRIPSVKTIQNMLGRRAGEPLPVEQAKEIRRALEKYVADPHGIELYGYSHHKSHARTHALNEVSKILGASGVEHISDRDGDTVLSYVNMGDPYTPTVWFDGNFGVGDYGSWVESYEKRHGRLP